MKEIINRIVGKNNWQETLKGIAICMILLYLLNSGVIPVPENWMTQLVPFIPLITYAYKKKKKDE